MHQPTTRRTFLRGLGVTMALPWLESLHAARWPHTPGRRDGEAPRRLAVLFSGNGFHSREWWAKGEGKTLEFGKVLEPLVPHRDKTLFVRVIRGFLREGDTAIRERWTDGPEGAVVETYAALYCAMTGQYGEALERLDSAIACLAIWP